ncbi:DUF6925 family protein [Bradyrhizobium manausense]
MITIESILPIHDGSQRITIANRLALELAQPETQWSLGTFGAIAEFVRDPAESAQIRTNSALTPRGAIRLELSNQIRLFAFETTTRRSWSSRVAVCLPRDQSAMNRRSVLTEIGPDREAVRREDRDDILFDIGVGAYQADICVRVRDPQLIMKLRENCGRATFAPGNPAGTLILEYSPHRAFISRVGRIEVYQPIPPSHGKSPEGPHTHVLPDLLRHRRTHAAIEPIPNEWVPCAYFYPAHPAKDSQGRNKAFDSQRQATFDATLRQFGDPDLIALKDRVRNAVKEGLAPSAVPTIGRFARANVRVVLRQLSAAGAQCPSLSDWIAAYERPPPDLDDEDQHIHHR